MLASIPSSAIRCKHSSYSRRAWSTSPGDFDLLSEQIE